VVVIAGDAVDMTIGAHPAKAEDSPVAERRPNQPALREGVSLEARRSLLERER